MDNFSSYLCTEYVIIIIVLIIVTTLIIHLICQTAISDANYSMRKSLATTMPNGKKKPKTLDDVDGSYDVSKIPPTSICPILDTKKKCEDKGNVWIISNQIDGHCISKNGYFGDQGQYQYFDKKYTSIGIPQKDDVSYKEIETIYTDSLSFATTGKSIFVDDACTDYCNDNKYCTGVIYDDKTKKCTLIKGEVKINKDKFILYDLDKDSTLYLKGKCDVSSGESSGCPKISDIVYLYNGKMPMRYWLRELSKTNNHNLKRIKRDEVTTIDFIPVNSVNDDGLKGIYSTYEFKIDDINKLKYRARHGDDQVYIHKEYMPLQIPIEWNSDNVLIYVVYI
jgi:hypothetical protein